MKEIINLVGNYCIQIRPDPYLVLVESIIYQQLTGRAAHSIYQRFVNHYNDVLLTPEKVLSTSNETMKSFSLSNKKIEYTKLLSKNITEKNFSFHTR
jgi:3-methyladenine DNA glycosylase/8-oxoguanine DNA glycosylase